MIRSSAMEVFLDAFGTGDVGAAIKRQEARGQQHLAAWDVMPIRSTSGTDEQLKALGFELGEPVDDLFREARLPEGWRKEPTDHSMWTDLVDSQGRKRGSIFYKAAFYDRDAFWGINCRFGVSVRPVGGWENGGGVGVCYHAVVLDAGEVIQEFGPTSPAADYGTDERTEWEAEKEMLGDPARTWLTNRFPLYQDPTAYWPSSAKE